jgi:hypothetical protein
MIAAKVIGTGDSTAFRNPSLPKTELAKAPFDQDAATVLV